MMEENIVSEVCFLKGNKSINTIYLKDKI